MWNITYGPMMQPCSKNNFVLGFQTAFETFDKTVPYTRPSIVTSLTILPEHMYEYYRHCIVAEAFLTLRIEVEIPQRSRNETAFYPSLRCRTRKYETNRCRRFARLSMVPHVSGCPHHDVKTALAVPKHSMIPVRMW
jgi:hypothetical protein